jgi:hypothetical protein
MQFSFNQMIARLFSAPLRRALLGVCTLILALQLIGAASHQHDAAEPLGDCVICQLAAHLPADIPGTPPALLAVFLVVAYLLARLPRQAGIVAPRYLFPVPQGPPAFPSSVH